MNVKSIVAIIVASLVLVLFAVPIIGGATFYEPAQNESDQRYTAYSGEDLEFEYSDSGLTLNGASVSGVVLISELFLVAVPDVYDFAAEKTISWVSGDTLTIDDGAVSGTGSFAGVSSNIGSECIYADSNGELGRFSGTSFHTNSSTKLYLSITSTPSLLAVGTIGGGFDTIRSVTLIGSEATEVPATSIALDSSQIDNSSTYQVTGGTVTLEGGTTKTPIVFAPIEYDTPSDGGSVGDIVHVIPVFIAIGILVGAVVSFRRD